MEALLELLKGKLVFGKIEMVDGKVRVNGSYDSAGIDVHLSIDVEAALFLQIVAKMIPGNIDDFLIGLIMAQLEQK